MVMVVCWRADGRWQRTRINECYSSMKSRAEIMRRRRRSARKCHCAAISQHAKQQDERWAEHRAEHCSREHRGAARGDSWAGAPALARRMCLRSALKCCVVQCEAMLQQW